MKDFAKSRRSVIRKTLENSPDGRRAELAKSANSPEVETIATNEERDALGQIIKEFGAMGAIYLLAKAMIQEDHSTTSVEAVEKAKVSVEQLVSPNSDKFTNLFSPGAVTAVISAFETERTRGWLPQNQVPRSVAGYFVSAGSDTKTNGTQSNYRNPESFGSGFISTIGRERYGDSRASSGTSEDQANSQISTSASPRDDRDLAFGHRNPLHPRASPGQSGNYGQSTLITAANGHKAAARIYSPVNSKADEEEAFKLKVGGVSQAKLDQLTEEDRRLRGVKTDEEVPLEVMEAARQQAIKREKEAESEDEPKSWKQTREDIEKSMFIKKLKKFGYLK